MFSSVYRASNWCRCPDERRLNKTDEIEQVGLEANMKKSLIALSLTALLSATAASSE
jgi:hypothetical protein